MKNLRNRKGFTLIELMIVVVIIGILAAIAIPRFSQVSKNAKQAEAGPILSQICTLEQSYYQRNDAYVSGTLSGTTLTGWDPGLTATYFTGWSFAAPSASATLTAAGTAAGLATPSMNCDTRVLTP
jgi:prepilin-type N-terminal cleavage/methylation domain-containing protein